jgi:hypothetical protein
MKQGMLWYDSQTAKDFYNRLELAISYFKEKYGFQPECCYVHPDMLKNIPKSESNIKVIPDEKVLHNHIWMEFPAAEKIPVISLK